MSFVDGVLSHYGVKGMRWGVRRNRGGISLGRRSSKPEPSEDKQKAEAARAKIGRRGNTDALSNEDLQTLVTRMNLEQNLGRLMANKKKGSASAIVQSLVANTAKDEFSRFAQGKDTKIIGTALALGAKGRHRKR